MTGRRLTRDRILADAIHWMAQQVDDARAGRAVEIGDAPRLRLHGERARATIEKMARSVPGLRDIVPERAGPVVAPPPPIDQHLAWTESLRRIHSTTIRSGQGELPSLAVSICIDWKEPLAGPLAEAWLDGEEVNTEALMGIDERTLAILLGVAAAAAVLAVVLFLRHGRTARIPPGRSLVSSPDFLALCAVAEGDGSAAEVAVAVRDTVGEPWAWTVRESLSQLAPDDRRSLLTAFASNGTCDVAHIRPVQGDTFDADCMTTAAQTTKDDRWVVAVEVPADQAGFRLGDRVEIPASVEVCTIDWWVLSRPPCPVGKVIEERADDLVAGGRESAPRWRAPWGLAHPEDLRELFDEPTLDAWRRRMVTELDPYYRDRPERRLSITGAPGDMFESSTMEPAGAFPVGDAMVEYVVERQGRAQHGLACPGGSPLLMAIVQPMPVRRANT